MSDETFVFVAVYDDKDAAHEDYELLKESHHEHLVGSYDVAVVTKNDKGRVHVHKHEKPTQHGAWTGVGVGALLGILFPPTIAVLPAAVVGGATGGLIGHLWGGMSRHDAKELGDLLDEGEAAIVAIGESKVDDVVKHELKRANRQEERAIKADAKEARKEINRIIDDLYA